MSVTNIRRKVQGVHKIIIAKQMQEERKPTIVTIKEWFNDDEELTPAKIAEFPGIIILEPTPKEDLELIAVLLKKPVWYIPNRPEITEIVQQIAREIKKRAEPSIAYPNIQPRQIIKKAC